MSQVLAAWWCSPHVHGAGASTHPSAKQCWCPVPSTAWSSLGEEISCNLEASEHHPPLEMLCFLLLAPQMEPALPCGQELVACPHKATGLLAMSPGGGCTLPQMGGPFPCSEFAQRMAQALSNHPDSVLHTINLAGNQLEDRGTQLLGWDEFPPVKTDLQLQIPPAAVLCHGGCLSQWDRHLPALAQLLRALCSFIRDCCL